MTDINSIIDKSIDPCNEELVEDANKFLCRVCYRFVTVRRNPMNPWCDDCQSIIETISSKHGKDRSFIRKLIKRQYTERRKVWIDRVKKRGLDDVFKGDILSVGKHSATVDYSGIVCEFNLDEVEALSRIKQRLNNPEYLKKRGHSCLKS